MLKYRIITAVLLIPIIIGVIFKASPLVFGIVSALIIGYSAWEWTRLIPITSHIKQIVYVLLMLLGIYLAYCLPVIILLGIGFLVICWCAVVVYCFQYEKNLLGFQRSDVRALLGFLLLIPCWDALVFLQMGTSFGPGWLLFALVLIWSADTGAYFAGRFLGKKSLASRVSPKKTWEGVWGGLLLVLIVAIIGSYFFSMNFNSRVLVWLLAIVAAIFSIVGDLAESVLKRIAGIKDIGQILPGHGGMLDRLDSVIGGLIVFALGTILLHLS